MYKTLTVFISVFLIDIFCRRNCLRMFSLKPLHWAVSLSSALSCASGNHAPAANTKIILPHALNFFNHKFCKYKISIIKAPPSSLPQSLQGYLPFSAITPITKSGSAGKNNLTIILPWMISILSMPQQDCISDSTLPHPNQKRIV